MGSVSIAVPFSDRWFFAEVVEGASARITAAGHRVRLHVIPPAPGSTGVAAAAIGEDFADHDCIGAIAAGFKYQADQSARVLAWQRPIVIVGGSVLGFPSVMIDDVGAARLAVEHLLALGHRRIAHFAGPLHDQMDFSIDGRRAKGYLALMEGAGLEPRLVENDFDAEGTYRAALALLQRPDRPTAVFAVSDEVAFPVLDAARHLGIEPGRGLSVVGIDDHPRAEPAGLTTVRQRPAEIGATAADVLLSGVAHGPNPKQSRLHPVSLVQRGSTARLRSDDGDVEAAHREPPRAPALAGASARHPEPRHFWSR